MHSENSTSHTIQELFERGLSASQIKEHLVVQGSNPEQLEEQMNIVKYLKYQRQRKRGFICLIIGVLLCASSCMLTFMHGYSDAYMLFTLYGLTLFGACFLLAGLALVMGI
jgi:hypothetical protein